MMQKRTNPLELKVNNTARAEGVAAPVAEPKIIDPVAAIVEPVKVEEAAPKAVPVAPAVKPIEPKTAEPAVEKKPLVKRPTVKPFTPEVEPQKEVEPEIEQQPEVKAAPVAPSAMHWERVSAYKPAPAAAPTAPVVEPEPIEIEEQETAVIEDEIAATIEQDDVLGDEMLDEALENENIENDLVENDADEFTAEDGISDEDEPLTIDDYMMSARFSLCGRVSRGMKVAKISRDVCRLAQLMHPEKSLSTILEDALLTRIYLENPDAFDALAEMLEKKGGHIKC
jgi:hypothetical protein